jgi:hypothetical protein
MNHFFKVFFAGLVILTCSCSTEIPPEKHRVLTIHSRPGETVKPDASKSFDPDDNEIRFNWYRSKEADSYPGDVVIEKPENALQSIVVPSDIKDYDIHLLLEVRDNGTPDLVTYRRVIIRQED